MQACVPWQDVGECIAGHCAFSNKARARQPKASSPFPAIIKRLKEALIGCRMLQPCLCHHASCQASVCYTASQEDLPRTLHRHCGQGSKKSCVLSSPLQLFGRPRRPILAAWRPSLLSECKYRTPESRTHKPSSLYGCPGTLWPASCEMEGRDLLFVGLGNVGLRSYMIYGFCSLRLRFVLSVERLISAIRACLERVCESKPSNPGSKSNS